MSMHARSRARAIARAFTSLSTSSTTASVSTTARVWTSELSLAHHRSLGELHATTRAFAASASPRVGASVYASNDGDDALDEEAAAAATARAPKPTKHKNHIKRMAQRDVARRENARIHKEGKHARAVEREEKRLERWRSAVELREEYARRNASSGGE